MTTQDDVARASRSGCRRSWSPAASSASSVAGRPFVSLWRERVDPKKPKVPNAEVIVVHVADLGEKYALLASDPERFFTTDHYDGYQGVLVRLPRVDVDEPAELIGDSWCLQAPTRAGAGAGAPLTASEGMGLFP